MARIDRLVQAMFQSSADRLIMASGERLVLVVGKEHRPVSPQPVTVAQIRDLLKEIVPPNLAGDVEQDGEHEFCYPAPAGTVTVKFTRDGEALRLEAGPLPITAAPSPARGPVIEGRKATLTIESLFVQMVREHCSDLHLTSGNTPLFRKHGEIVPVGDIVPFTAEQVAELLLSITPAEKRAEFERSHDVDFSHEIPGVARFRCNLFQDRRGMGGVFRVIPTDIQSAQELGLPPQILDLCNLHKGLVVVTGPTGSGKSTTLAAMIDSINRDQPVHIITIEDPIEFVHPVRKALINQREVGTHTCGFKTALRAALREDPDIVLVGEMRDLETVAIAIETAETGHLVFGTLHTNTAASTVDRIIDQFPADRQNQIRAMLSESLKGVIAQTLCRRKGGGRVAALEILLVSPAVSNLIREGKTFQIPSVMQTGRGSGMITLSDSLLELVKKGQVEPEEAYANAVNKQELRSMLERSGVKLQAA
ncbi:MAG TPA: type IV pilus twitching motility protein PilT [Candidatus Polarisedimenticolia bacterium]|jgi:twitching motility protein PilT|nr:type IV pilus twitching motility protein PilT [Candidatus Polarisedimenticolia bacterium]